MKTLSLITVTGALALAVPAFADDAPSTDAPSTPSAEQQCRTERAQMGRDAFALLYGTNKNRRNAFGKCVSKRNHATTEAAKTAKTNASKECTAEEAADKTAFEQKYGTGKNGSNAHGKCVSQKAKAKTTETVKDQVAADVKAAKACKAERKADPSAFAAKYGTNRNKSNAFGKCVSRAAKAQS
jgi:hypothetical protein